jgi:ethanolamine utilization cobalamin adenosyltransferase
LRLANSSGTSVGGQEYVRERDLISPDNILGRDIEVVRRTSPDILEAINKNGLVIFLLVSEPFSI